MTKLWKYDINKYIIVNKENKILIVKKPRNSHAWQFPQGGREKNENALQAAQREIREECGEDLEVELKSNSIGQYRYLYPRTFKRHKPGIKGAHVEFFQADYKSGEVKINTEELKDYKWVTKEEFKEYFEEDYLEAISRFL